MVKHAQSLLFRFFIGIGVLTGELRTRLLLVLSVVLGDNMSSDVR